MVVPAHFKPHFGALVLLLGAHKTQLRKMVGASGAEQTLRKPPSQSTACASYTHLLHLRSSSALPNPDREFSLHHEPQQWTSSKQNPRERREEQEAAVTGHS